MSLPELQYLLAPILSVNFSDDQDYWETLIFDNPDHQRACIYPLLLESSPPPESLDEYHKLVSKSDRSLLRILAITSKSKTLFFPRGFEI